MTVIGCVIMLQFAPRLTKPQGHLYHESIGDAIEMLNVKLKVKHIGVTGNMVLKFIKNCILIDVDIWYSGLWLVFFLIDVFEADLTDEKAKIFSTSVPSIKSLHTDASSIVNIDLLSNPLYTSTDTLKELYLDMEGDDYRGDLMNYLQNSGLRLSTLELKKMSFPVDISQLSRLCPSLNRIKVIKSCCIKKF